MTNHKYVNVHRHQLLILSKINNGWSMAVTVLQRIASTQQIGLLLVPAIKGAVYINTHCNYSQPELTTLYNENIGGHPYTFTAVCEIFSVRVVWPWKQVRVHSRSLEVAPFDRSYTSSYSPSIVTMVLSRIICDIKRRIGRKLGNFYTPPVISAHVGGDPVWISWRCLMLIKLEWLGTGEKTMTIC